MNPPPSTSHPKRIISRRSQKLIAPAESRLGLDSPRKIAPFERLDVVFSSGVWWLYLTESVYNVVWQKSIPAQICQLILHHYEHTE